MTDGGMRYGRIADRVAIGNIRNIETGVIHAPMSDTDRVPLCGLRCRKGPWETVRAVTCKRCIANVATKQRQAAAS